MDFSVSKEQETIKKEARKFALGEFPHRALEFDREETFDLKLWKKACDLGFVGAFIGEEYDGPGYGFFEHCLITEEFWAVEPGIAMAILSTTFGAELLELFGSEKQKKKILPNLVHGESIIGTAITEPDAGCDVTGAVTSAVRANDEWILNGTKMFATNGNIATHMLIFCRTNPDHPSRHKQHSFFLVPTDSPGFRTVKIRGKMGIRASNTAEIILDKVRIPSSNIVGKEGEGFHELMAFFNRTRLHICAQAVGLSRSAFEESIRHIKNRKQFGKPLSEFQATRFKIAEMTTKIRAARNLYYEAAWLADQGKIDQSLIAMAKWYSAKVAVSCADEALQMHGGYGYIDEYKVQRLYRDAKILEIYEGTKEIEKIIIAKAVIGD